MDLAGRVLVPGRTDHDQCLATIWIPQNTMSMLAPMAMARAVVKTDASSHTLNARWLMPAGQRALMRWEICGT
jgi:hypothetical protein